MDDADYPGGWFGTSWGAPVCDPVRHLSTPVGEECLFCEKVITADDSGLTIPGVGATILRSMHIECFLDTIGVDHE